MAEASWAAERSGAAGSRRAGPKRPNIVVVLADDMGWGDLGCNGSVAIPTPRIDALARGGVRLTDAHSASAVCTPSRYALLTGRYAWRSPLKRHVLRGHSPALIEPERPTLASVLQADGYATGAFGKWHLGLGWRWKDGHIETAFDPEVPPRVWSLDVGDTNGDVGDLIDYTQPFTGGPLELGFERFFGISGSLDMPPYCFLDQDRTLGVPDRPKETYITSQRPGFQVEGWRDDEVDVRVTAEATAWLAQRASEERPFLLYLAPTAPHRPCVPPAFVQGRSQAGDRGDAVCLVDWTVGRIVDTLTEMGQLDDTLVIFTSDNGAPTIYPEDGDTETHRPNGPWRGQKGDIWDGGHREPFVAHWPGRIPAGSVRSDLVGLVDLVTTLLGAADVAVPDGAAEDGTDVLGVLTGAAAVDPERLLVHHSMKGGFALRRGRWKAEFCTGSGLGFSKPGGELFGPDNPVGQLYDLDADPTESTNLWHQRPDVVREAYEALQRICGDASSGLPFGVALPDEPGL